MWPRAPRCGKNNRAENLDDKPSLYVMQTMRPLLKKLLRKLLRILAGLALALIVLWTVLFMTLRQPNFGHTAVQAEGKAEPEILRRHVVHLTENIVPRDADHPKNLSLAADYIRAAFEAGSGRVEEQTFDVDGEPYRNVSVFFGPETGPRLVVGAHYDAFGMFGPNPGADDNASGTAGLLELARLLSRNAPSLPVELVAYANEEPPNYASDGMGSAVHAKSLAEAGIDVRAMICLEMIGYFTDEQPWPNVLYSMLYPNTGDFIGVVGRFDDRKLVRRWKRAMRRPELPVYSFTGPSFVPGLDASDHRNYWHLGYPALMVTDTAFMRNPNYHTAGDTADSLSYGPMAHVVDSVLAGILSEKP